MTLQAYLLWRALGATWAVPSSAGVTIVKGEKPEIHVGDAVFPADEVLGLAQELTVRQAGRVLRAFWPYPCLGLAVVDQQPLVVLPPSALSKVLFQGES
ncbi:MAG: hypothetical protein ACUVRE_05030 [Thermoanaerobaculaceae bacterium]